MPMLTATVVLCALGSVSTMKKMDSKYRIP